jgi:hypothetical protein
MITNNNSNYYTPVTITATAIILAILSILSISSIYPFLLSYSVIAIVFTICDNNFILKTYALKLSLYN